MNNDSASGRVHTFIGTRFRLLAWPARGDFR